MDKMIEEQVLPKLIKSYNSFHQRGDTIYTLADFYGPHSMVDVVADSNFQFSIYEMRQVTVVADSGDDGGGALVTATFSRALLPGYDWKLVSILHLFDSHTTLIYKEL